MLKFMKQCIFMAFDRQIILYIYIYVLNILLLLVYRTNPIVLVQSKRSKFDKTASIYEIGKERKIKLNAYIITRLALGCFPRFSKRCFEGDIV